MSSILTNASAITALQSLQMTQNNLASVQNQISTGLKVSSAADNAAYWSIATTMSSDNGALGAVSTALGESAQMINVANAAITASISGMNQIKNDLVAAQQPGADLNAIGADISQASAQLASNVQSAAFNGSNWLDGSNSTIKLVAGFNRDAAGATSVGTIDITGEALIATGTGATAGSGILEGGTGTAAGTGTDFTTITVSSATTATQLATMSADADATLAKLQTYASNLGSTQTRVSAQSTFITSLSNALTTGVSSLVDADMNAASTRLSALQTQQQLGVQSLSIANQSSQMIMKLFG